MCSMLVRCVHACRTGAESNFWFIDGKRFSVLHSIPFHILCSTFRLSSQFLLFFLSTSSPGFSHFMFGMVALCRAWHSLHNNEENAEKKQFFLQKRRYSPNFRCWVVVWLLTDWHWNDLAGTTMRYFAYNLSFGVVSFALSVRQCCVVMRRQQRRSGLWVKKCWAMRSVCCREANERAVHCWRHNMRQNTRQFATWCDWAWGMGGFGISTRSRICTQFTRSDW